MRYVRIKIKSIDYLECDICKQQFNNKIACAQYINHLENKHNGDRNNLLLILKDYILIKETDKDNHLIIDYKNKQLLSSYINYSFCKLCNKELISESGYQSHIKREHKLNFYEFLFKEFKQLNKNFKYELCGFCNKNQAVPKYDIDYKNKTFLLSYKEGFFCYDEECIYNRHIEFLGEYNIKKYEHIGSKPEYLAKKYKVSIKEASIWKQPNIKTELKRNPNLSIDEANKIVVAKFNYRKSRNCSLKSYIERYGEESGRKKYQERCNKIGYCQSVNWFIDKFGKELGKQKYQERLDKIIETNKKNCLGTSKSKSSNKIKNFLELLKINYIKEYPITTGKESRLRYFDYYLPDYNIGIEYYGWFWHCNPKNYNKDYYHPIKKKYASEIWENDEKRIDMIRKAFENKITILIIWENSHIDEILLNSTLNNIKKSNSICYI